MAATVTSTARAGVPKRYEGRRGPTAACRRSDARCSICSASPRAACAAGTRISTAAAASATAISVAQRRRRGEVLRQAGQRRIRPERAVRSRARAAGRGTCPSAVASEREDDGQQAGAPQGLHAGGGNSCAARASASPPPIDRQRQREAEHDRRAPTSSGRHAGDRRRSEEAPSSGDSDHATRARA